MIPMIPITQTTYWSFSLWACIYLIWKILHIFFRTPTHNPFFTHKNTHLEMFFGGKCYSKKAVLLLVHWAHFGTIFFFFHFLLFFLTLSQLLNCLRSCHPAGDTDCNHWKKSQGDCHSEFFFIILYLKQYENITKTPIRKTKYQ